MYIYIYKYMYIYIIYHIHVSYPTIQQNSNSPPWLFMFSEKTPTSQALVAPGHRFLMGFWGVLHSSTIGPLHTTSKRWIAGKDIHVLRHVPATLFFAVKIIRPSDQSVEITRDSTLW